MMCALLSPLPTFGLPLEDTMSHQLNHVYRESLTPQSFSNFPPCQLQALQTDDCSTSFPANGGDRSVVKKLYHNASERDRRKRINVLYSTLRSLLPATDHTKKLSIPATITRVLQYIPELRQEVEKLVQEKEELLCRLNTCNEKKRESGGSSTCVSATRIGDREVMIQISTYKIHQIPFSEILLHLEEDGLFLLNVSSFESSRARVFYSLHLQGYRSYKLDSEVLTSRILTMFP